MKDIINLMIELDPLCSTIEGTLVSKLDFEF